MTVVLQLGVPVHHDQHGPNIVQRDRPGSDVLLNPLPECNRLDTTGRRDRCGRDRRQLGDTAAKEHQSHLCGEPSMGVVHGVPRLRRPRPTH